MTPTFTFFLFSPLTEQLSEQKCWFPNNSIFLKYERNKLLSNKTLIYFDRNLEHIYIIYINILKNYLLHFFNYIRYFYFFLKFIRFFGIFFLLVFIFFSSLLKTNSISPICFKPFELSHVFEIIAFYNNIHENMYVIMFGCDAEVWWCVKTWLNDQDGVQRVVENLWFGVNVCSIIRKVIKMCWGFT